MHNKRLYKFKREICKNRQNIRYVINIMYLIQFKNVQSGLCQKYARSWSKWEKIEKSASFWDIQK